MLLLWFIVPVLVLLYVLRIRRTRRENGIPSPWGIPIIGHLPFVNLSAPHLTFSKWQKTFGNIFKVNMGGTELVVVHGHEAIKELLTRPEYNYRPDMFRINVYREDAGFGFSPPDKSWRRLRKAVHQGIRAYGEEGKGRVNRIISEINGNTLDQISQKHESSYDPWETIYNHMLQSLTAFTMGEHVTASKELYDIVARLDALAMDVLSPVGPGAMLDSAPWLRHVGHPTWKKMQEMLAVRDDMWRLVRPALMAHSSDVASIAHNFMQAKDDTEGIDEQRVKCAIGDMMIAGTHATSVSMYCLLHILSHHPHMQQRIQQEIDATMPGATEPSVEDMGEMPYTRAVMLELQRYVSITPLGLPHCAGKEGTLGGMHIPAGTSLLPNLWSLHRDEEFWSEPDAFVPDRYLTSTGELLPCDHPNRRRMLGFGLGPRLCPGENFAYSRIFLLLCSLLKQYTLRIDPAHSHVPYDPRTFPLSLSVIPNRYELLTLPRVLTKASRPHRMAGEQ